MTVTTPNYTIYLLCDDARMSKIRHYLGSTKGTNVEPRLRRHLAGTGGKTTARMLAAGAHLHLARTWQTTDRSLEKQLKQAGHFARLCPLCSPQFPLPPPPVVSTRTNVKEDTKPWKPIGF